MVIRLRSDAGEQLVLAGHLVASPGFAVLDAEPAPAVDPFGLLDALPKDVLAAAKQRERHVVEVETGRPGDAPDDVESKSEYDPGRTTMNERDAAKATELGVAVRTVQSWRARVTPSRGFGAWSTSAPPERCKASAGRTSG